jgi:hypothetical protein
MRSNSYFCVCLALTISSQDSAGQTLSDTVDKHLIFKQALTEGVYNFNSEGVIPAEPLVRIRKIQKEMIHTIQSINDHKKQIKYLLTLSNTCNDDLSKLRQKIESSGLGNYSDLDKNTLKADGNISLHMALSYIYNIQYIIYTIHVFCVLYLFTYAYSIYTNREPWKFDKSCRPLFSGYDANPPSEEH